MTSLFKKLNFKGPCTIYFYHAPLILKHELEKMSEWGDIFEDEKKPSQIDFAMIFVINQLEIDEVIQIIDPMLSHDAVLWFCYPKGSSKKYKSDINRDKGWNVLGKYSFEPVRQVAIDEDWSALRFRKIHYIKKMTRREDFFLSEEGRNRSQKNEDPFSGIQDIKITL